MPRPKVFDCITFYDENLITNARFEILKDTVDKFVVCESIYDQKGNRKEINFKLKNQAYKEKIKYLLIQDKFPNAGNGWKAEEFQRNYILDFLDEAQDDDLIMYSDSDEIPNPESIKNLNLTKKFGIFLQKFYVYKINIFNPHETPWEGTRITQKKNLKNINLLRKKIRLSNLKKPIWKFYHEKSIQVIDNGGWHFNNLYSVEKISNKLKAFPHQEFNNSKFTDTNYIHERIKNLGDLFFRGHKYRKVQIDSSYPKYIIENIDLFEDFILKT